jgi:ABC-type glycerol-3-phosphate transport system permease component
MTALRSRSLGGSIALHGVLGAAALVVLAPFAWLITSSFKTNEDFFATAFLPRGDGVLGIAWDRLTFAHFTRLVTDLGFEGHLVNSIFLASVTSVVATAFAAMGGFALARYRFRGRLPMTILVLAMIIIPPQLLITPLYQLLFRVNLLDTFTGLIIPSIAPAFGVFLFRQAALTAVPPQLMEAARIDGCGELRFFALIALPLMRPMIGAFMLITFLATWNNFISPQVILQTREKFPLSVAVAQLQGVYYQEYGLQMAATLLSIIPVLILFLILQKEFISGLTSGAVKE